MSYSSHSFEFSIRRRQITLEQAYTNYPRSISNICMSFVEQKLMILCIKYMIRKEYDVNCLLSSCFSRSFTHLVMFDPLYMPHFVCCSSLLMLNHLLFLVCVRGLCNIDVIHYTCDIVWTFESVNNRNTFTKPSKYSIIIDVLLVLYSKNTSFS